MIGYASPLWLLGLGSANPRVADGVGAAIVGIHGPAFALPVKTGTRLPLAALSVLGGDNGAALALPALGAVHGTRTAAPVLTGVIYG
jgi:hypothetical protein